MTKRNEDFGCGIMTGAGIAICSIFLILLLAGAFRTVWGRYDIDKDLLARDYVLEYYPEFGDCRIKYTYNIYPKMFIPTEGVSVYCNETGDIRDELELVGEKSATYKIAFDDITLKDILIRRLGEYKK